jgi:hypothetical protein
MQLPVVVMLPAESDESCLPAPPPVPVPFVVTVTGGKHARLKDVGI